VTRDVQLPGPASDLLATARRVVPGWLRRITLAAANRADIDREQFFAELDAVVTAETERVLAALEGLLATDVDEQRTNPLTLFRDAVRAPTELLARHGVAPPSPDAFATSRFPSDLYRLGPATWSDIDPALHEPGITWGAWKAITVLRRRREEGLR
jgi:hypothetical protein